MDFQIANSVDMTVFATVQQVLVPRVYNEIVSRGYQNVQITVNVIGSSINVAFFHNSNWVKEFAIVNVKGQLMYIPVYPQ